MWNNVPVDLWTLPLPHHFHLCRFPLVQAKTLAQSHSGRAEMLSYKRSRGTKTSPFRFDSISRTDQAYKKKPTALRDDVKQHLGLLDSQHDLTVASLSDGNKTHTSEVYQTRARSFT